MKVGIIIHSHTGNTLAVAEKLQERLMGAGHQAEIQRVTASNEDPNAPGPVVLENTPDLTNYEAIILGAPVRAFSLSPVMKAYLAQVPSFTGKQVSCFVTQHFPFAWMGGNNSIRQMKNACAAKGTRVTLTGVVNWSHKQREEKIARLLDAFTIK